MEKYLNRRNIILALAGITILILASLGFRQTVGFRLLSSSPSGTSEHQYSPIVFTFSQELAATNEGVNQILLNPNVQGATIVSGKKAMFEPLEPYDPSVNYKVTLKGPTAKAGGVLPDITFTFRPNYVDISKLPAKYQTPKEGSDVKETYSPSVINIGGSAALLSHGLTSDQLTLLQEDFYTWFASQKLEYRDINLTNMVQFNASRDTSGPDYFTFNVVINGKQFYTAKMEYRLVTIHLQLFDPQSKALVYDSDTFDPDAAGGEDTP